MWQNADELPPSMDNPCPHCGCAVVACMWTGQHSFAVLCAEDHVHVIESIGWSHPDGSFISILCSAFLGRVA